MIVLKIIGIAIGFVLASIWVVVIISAGVASGLKSYFENHKGKK